MNFGNSLSCGLGKISSRSSQSSAVHGYLLHSFSQSFQSKHTFQAASSQGTLDEIEEEQETEEQQVGFIPIYPFLSRTLSCMFEADQSLLFN